MATAEELQELALRLSAFTDTLTQHANRLMRDNQQASRGLLQATHGFAEQSRLLSQQVVQTVANETRAAVERGAGEGLRSAAEQLKQAAAEVRKTQAGLAKELAQLRASQRSLIRKGGLALLVGCVLAVAASSYMAWKARQTLAQAEFPEAVLRATRTGALTQCGDSLCARVGRKPRRFGTSGEFAEVR